MKRFIDQREVRNTSEGSVLSITHFVRGELIFADTYPLLRLMYVAHSLTPVAVSGIMRATARIQPAISNAIQAARGRPFSFFFLMGSCFKEGFRSSLEMRASASTTLISSSEDWIMTLPSSASSGSSSPNLIELNISLPGRIAA